MRLAAQLMTICCLATSALAQPARQLEVVLLLEGDCTKMRAPSVDLTADCKGKLTRDTFSDRRTGFTFFVSGPGKDPVALTFTGMATGQVSQDGGVTVQPIDGLIMSIGNRPINGRAVGACRYGDPFKPSGFVDCIAEVSEGQFEGKFQQNATAPMVIRGQSRK